MSKYPQLDLSHPIVEMAGSFIYTHARLLDRLRFAHLTGQGSPEAVMKSLAAYQNKDGGFGHALEPDIRSPYSQPQGAEFALHLMDEAGIFPESIMTGLGQFLERYSNPQTGGWPYSFRSVNEHPHAPWWTTESDDAASINPTGTIVSLLLKSNDWHPFLKEKWFNKAAEYTWDTLDRTDLTEFHDIIQGVHFLEQQKDDSRSKALQARIDQQLAKGGVIELDPRAEGYVQKVLDWAPTPASYAVRFIPENIVSLHLDHLISEQQEDGGWPISWPPLSSAAENEWRGHITIERLKTLASYGRI
ncbi:hypothetical protein M3231_08540 [Neobacillus mesonae]|nr:hypothetical protein [Neobacillus mesonae]